jgi:diguanylate cyclase (GGDEF)-like protein/PAS domain S-box-containing protein
MTDPVDGPPGQEASQSALVLELRRTLARLELALGQISDGLVITDGGGRILWCNQSFETLLRQPRLLMLGRTLEALLRSHLDQEVRLDVADRIRQGSTGGSFTAVVRRDPLQVLEVQWRLVASEQPPPLIYSFRDVSDRVSLEELRLRSREMADRQLALAQQVVTCPVTGLPNRRGLSQAIADALQRLDRQPAWLAVLFCDLNRFKEINDTYGHRIGDQLLVELASRMNRVLRQGDVLGRLGGDEFVLLCRDLDEPHRARRIAERLRDAVAAPWMPETGAHSIEIQPRISIGIALCRDSHYTPDQLLHDADLAMYEAKACSDDQSPDQIVMFDETLNATQARKLLIRTSLQQVLRQQRLELHFQPIVRLLTGEVVAFEGLVRPIDLQGVAIPPTEFIAVAESSGLVNALGRLVLETGLGAAAELGMAARGHGLALNFSAKQCCRSGIAAELIAAAERFGFPPALLTIEITETALIDQPQRTRQELTALREAGFRVNLDDFGIGYSSLNWLAELPIDGLKIDRSFTASMTEDPRRHALIAAILRLAGDLRLEVIAEGIESCQQWEALKDMGCQLGQGYLFSRPLALRVNDLLPAVLHPAGC